MNTANWHLLLNHLPVAATIIGTCVLIAGLVLKNAFIQRTALGVFIASTLATIPVYLTGEGAEDVVKNLPGVTENYIEEHEEMANIFFIAVIVLGITSLAIFFIDILKSGYIKLVYNVVLLFAITACVLAKQVGTSGGEIRHTEIRGETAVNAQSPGDTQSNEMNKEKEDD